MGKWRDELFISPVTSRSFQTFQQLSFLPEPTPKNIHSLPAKKPRHRDSKDTFCPFSPLEIAPGSGPRAGKTNWDVLPTLQASRSLFRYTCVHPVLVLHVTTSVTSCTPRRADSLPSVSGNPFCSPCSEAVREKQRLWGSSLSPSTATTHDVLQAYTNDCAVLPRWPSKHLKPETPLPNQHQLQALGERTKLQTGLTLIFSSASLKCPSLGAQTNFLKGDKCFPLVKCYCLLHGQSVMMASAGLLKVRDLLLC